MNYTLRLSNNRFPNLPAQAETPSVRDRISAQAYPDPAGTQTVQPKFSAAACKPCCCVNPGKAEFRTVGGRRWQRLALRTHVLTHKDSLRNTVEHYALPFLMPGDVLFISEKAVACTQNRAIAMEQIHPRPLARLLCRCVHKTPFGIGLGIPETMEMALKECGVVRILFAALVSAFGKLIGRRGWFYKIAGSRASAIDGPCDCTIPPYNHYVVLGPENPDKTAHMLAEAIGFPVAIVDINDLGAQILGVSGPDLDVSLLCEILRDNPLGQGHQSTPMGILRAAGEPA